MSKLEAGVSTFTRLAAIGVIVVAGVLFHCTGTAPEDEPPSPPQDDPPQQDNPTGQGPDAGDQSGDDNRDDEPVDIRLLAVNDIHGFLEGPTGRVVAEGDEVAVGGVAYLAAHADELRSSHEHTTFVHAGDLFGGSPTISDLFYEESTIEVSNEMRLDIAGVGNHEFNRGANELLRLVDGENPAAPWYPLEGQFEGADFEYLAANVRWNGSDDTVLPPYIIRDYDGVSIGYIGLTLEGTPGHLPSGAHHDITFHEEVETVSRFMPEMKDQGADTIVLIIHEGGRPEAEPDGIADCADVDGPIVDIVERLPDEIEVVVSGHTHEAYICEFGDTLVTQAANSGRVITTIDLRIDPTDSSITELDAAQHPVTQKIEPNERIASIVDEYTTLVEELTERPIGKITDDIPAGEHDDDIDSMSRLVADARREATAGDGVDIAFVSPRNIRTGLDYKDTDDGIVTYPQLHAVQPFNNRLITITLTGEQLRDLLQQQIHDDSTLHLLAVSSGFSYQWTIASDDADRLHVESVRLHDEPLEPTGEYRVVIDEFLAGGAHGFTKFTEGTNRTTTPHTDLSSLITYIETNSPVAPPTNRRILPD